MSPFKADLIEQNDAKVTSCFTSPRPAHTDMGRLVIRGCVEASRIWARYGK